MAKKSQPNPPPENVYAERLRWVREHHGEDIKTFHGRLKTEGGVGVSYAAARHYDFDRVAPPDYFVAVAKVYGAKLDWLLTGERPRTEREAKTIEAAGEPDEDPFSKAWRALRKAEGRLPFRLDRLDILEREAWRDLAIRLLDAGPERKFEDYDEEDMVEALEPLAWLLWFPIMALQPGAPPTDTEHYFLAMYQALSIAMPEAGEGNTDVSMRVLRDIKEAVKQRSRHGIIERGPDRRVAETKEGVDDQS